MVPRVGLEPTHLAAGDFESPASTNFATWAVLKGRYYNAFFENVKRFFAYYEKQNALHLPENF